MIIGLVGKPSSGKSTFFKAATLANVEISPRPFTTIKPNRGIAYVSLECVDKEFNVQCQPRFGYCLQHRRFVPIDLLDVPGLIPDAHKGSGLGNQFLDDLRQADVLIHIVDISGKTNEQGQITENHDPSKDIQFLEYELDQWYLSILKKGWDKFARGIQQEHQNIIKALAKQLSGLKVSESMVDESMKKLSLPENPVSWNEQQLFSLAQELRKLSKPMILAANKIDIPGAEENYERIRKQFPQYLIIPCSAESELALREASKHKLIQYAPGEKDFQIPEYAVVYSRKPLQLVGCLGWDCAESGVDRAGFWVTPGRVERVMSPLEMIFSTGKMVISEDIGDINKAVKMPKNKNGRN